MTLLRKQNSTLSLAEKTKKVSIDAETISWFLIQFVQNLLKTYNKLKKLNANDNSFYLFLTFLLIFNKFFNNYWRLERTM